MHLFKTSLRPVVIISLIIIGIGSGCSELTQAEIKALETRELDLSYKDAYSAAANGLFSLGFTIDHSDMESGIISGRRTKKVAGLSVTFLLILPLPTINESTHEEAITFMLTKLEPTISVLRMKIVVNGEPVVDRELMTQIWQRIEREALLETRPSDYEPKIGKARPN